MSSSHSLRAQLDFQTRLFNNVTEGISEHESQVHSVENINNIKWVAGHVLDARLNTMSKMTGLAPDDSLGALFRRGTVWDAAAAYPTFEEIRVKWAEVSVRISGQLTKLREDTLLAKAPFESPIFNIDDTNHGVFLFLLTHEAMHIGQLSILRRMAGKDAMTFR